MLLVHILGEHDFVLVEAMIMTQWAEHLDGTQIADGM